MNDMDNELTNTELTRVSNALDALQQHNQQPTTPAWEAIMEESTNRSRQSHRRTQLMSIAAAVIIVSVAGAAFVLTSKNENVRTVDNKKSDKVVTTTTIPLTDEQSSLQNTIIVSRLNTSDRSEGLAMVDGATSEPIGGFDDFIKDHDLFNALISYVGGNTFMIESGVSPSCDTYTKYYFNVKTQETSSLVGNYRSTRQYSPSGNVYAEFSGDCGEIVTSTTLTIVNSNTGKKTVIQPEKYTTDELQFESEIGADSIKWIDDNEFLLGISLSPGDSSYWSLENLNNTISLNESVKKGSFVYADSAGFYLTWDVKKVNGKIYTLASHKDDVEGAREQISVREAGSNKTVWTKELGSEVDSVGTSLHFGNDIDSVYGSVFDGGDEEAFIYSHKLDQIFSPSGIFITHLGS